MVNVIAFNTVLVSRHLLWFNQSTLTASFCRGLLTHQQYMGAQVPLLLRSVYTLTHSSVPAYLPHALAIPIFKAFLLGNHPKAFHLPHQSWAAGADCTSLHVCACPCGCSLQTKDRWTWIFLPSPKRKQASTSPPLFSELSGKQQSVIRMLFHGVHLFSLPRGVVVSGLPVLWVHGYGPEQRALASRPISTVLVIFAEVGRREVKPVAAAGGTCVHAMALGLDFFLLFYSAFPLDLPDRAALPLILFDSC